MPDSAPDPPPAPDPARTVGVTPEEARRTAERAAAPAPAPPVVIPGYEILGELGRGGMGAVYKARQVALGREVAVKTILGDPADPLAAGRFLAEAVAVAAVNHPHVVQVFEFGTAAGRPFLAMEYVPGDTLAARLRAGPLAPPAAAALVEKIARGVHAAHDRQIVHRDLKPGNVLLDARGEPKVTDFGLAKRAASDLTATRAVMGTPAYMAPEQARGGTKFVGPAADVYALGVILYECLTGRRPFDDPDPLVLLRQVAEDDPVPPRRWAPAVPRDLERVCLKCLEKYPGRRYATAADLADDLRRVLVGEPVTARPPREWELAYQWARKRSLLIQVIGGLTAAAMCTCVTSVAVVTTFGRAPDPAPAAAEARPADPPPRFEPAALVAGGLFAVGFVGTLALVVRPRRWVLLAGAAAVLMGLAGHALAAGFGDAWTPLAGLAAGVVLGALVGLPARLVAWWLRADTTDVLLGAFLGGATGPPAAGFLAAPVVLARAHPTPPGDLDPVVSAAILGGMLGGYALGALAGAWRSPTRREWVRVERARDQHVGRAEG